MPTHKRSQFFVDPKVQGALLFRLAVYWMLCLTAAIIFLLCWQVLTGPARMFYTQLGTIWQQFGPAIIASLLLLPVAGIDLVRQSNRFVGPMVRLRRAMKALAEGKPVRPIYFRKGDFWQSFTDDFNTLLSRVEQLEKSRAASPEELAQTAKEDDSLAEPVGS